MSERDILLDWLTRASQRLRLLRRLHELGWIATALIGLLALYLALRALPLPAPVLAATAPLLLLAAIAALPLSYWRLTRRPSLAHTAGRADARAGLDDELKSAYWFVRQEDQSTAVASMLRHAAHTVQRLELRQVFPVSVPGSVLCAAALAAAAAMLAALPPRAGEPQVAEPGVPGTAAAVEAARLGTRVASAGSDDRSALDAPERAARSDSAREDDEVWSQVEQAARKLDSGEQREALERAVQSRDAARALQLLEALQPGSPEDGNPAAHPEANQVSPEVAQGILQRLQELLKQDDEPAGPDSKPIAEQGELRVSQEQGREPQAGEQRDQAHSDQAEDLLNAAMRSLSRNDIGGRPAVGGQGESGQESGATELNGGAMGRRVSRSRAGAGDGNAPPGNPSGNAEAEPVLGKQTLRLVTQLQRRNVGGSGAEQDDGTPEAFYAATQAQASRLELEPVEAGTRSSDEDALEHRQLPLAYRSAVRKYFVTEHEKDN